MTLAAVVTPVYNGAKFLDAAMRAVQAQSYRPLIHVVLDNASTDATPEIIARYANAEIPVVTARNEAVLPAPKNWSAAVRLVPDDVRYFKILCADDEMVPDAIAKMMAVARSADDVRMVFGMDRFNGVPRWHNMPAECSVFDCSAMTARILADGADVPWHHAMYRIDTRQPDEDFFPSDVISFDAEAGFRVLSRGGRCGIVTEAVCDTLDHAGSLTSTWTNKAAAQHWEHLVRLRRYGPAALNRREWERTVRTMELRITRKILWRLLSGRREVALRDLDRLAEIGRRPGLAEFAQAVATWPAHLHYRKILWRRAHAPWPTEALQPSAFRSEAAPHERVNAS